MNVTVTVGGKTYPSQFTALDHRDLGRAGVLDELEKLPEFRSWDQNDAMARFLAACIRRAGGQMTPEDLLLVMRPEEREPLFAAVAELLGMSKGTAGPNAEGPGSTATST